MSLCQYNNSLGEPNKGVHKHVMGVAIIDVLMTIVAAYLISKNTEYSFAHTLIMLFLAAILLNKLIFGEV
jgi:hypothetical protein